MSSNTRDGERVPAPGQLTGEVTVYEPVTILDLSDRGALVETQFALHLDSLHEFRLSLGNRSVVVKGRIAHCQIGELHEGTILYRTGVEFIEPSDHVLSAIHSFVEALKFAATATPRIVEAELADEGN
jgi:PilZ domain-containing protein